MEKLLDGVIPEEGERYTIVLLATPTKMQEQRKLDLYEKYSEIAHLASFESNMTINDSRSASKNTTLGENAGDSHGWSLLLYNQNYNYGTSFSKAVTDSYQLGKSEGMTRSYVNYGIKHTLENLELQTKRLEEATALGLWDFSAYVISGNPTLTRNVAHTYLSLTQGSDSYIGKAAVNIWNYDKKEELDIILKSLSRLRHPSFVLNESAAKENNDLLMYPTLVDTTVELSGKELAFALNFPRKSISGLPVLESAAFGREVQKYDLIDSSSESISIGNVVHMRHTELQEVNLDLNSLTAHAFVTGSTGAGKTNSILQILSKAEEKGTKYLIIEPAKGEYKGYIGGKCKVYGTNPRFNELIKINPFSFPENISVVEHIDRLVEILNACWPMYAAMPAILKDAIEKTYVNKGWDLNGFSYLPDRFPTFIDLLEALPEVINDSSYSADTQSDYKGALITRVKSLTNGINGQIICATNEISPEELFRENVILDLSRVSSTETKALLMGVMVMKLQEYNINKGSGAFTKELKHLTVLEEAHNLLRKTSTEQSQESSNLQGKSVEMISNAIAEMRAYGEGFIISDQAPDLLDESVIRNTNTKIVLRLPDNNDRECVGKAAALKDNQIDELAKLPKGVAAVYQNDWVEAVLCQFKEFTDLCPMKEVMYVEPQNQKYNAAELLLGKIYMDESKQFADDQVECIRKWIESLRFGDYTKRKLATYRQRLLVIAMYENHIDSSRISYEIPKLHIGQSNYVRSMNYTELEDIVAVYMAERHGKDGYYLLPSSCKISQQNYEFTFVSNDKNPITCQVKNQNEIEISHYVKETSYEWIYMFSGKWDDKRVEELRKEYADYTHLYIISPSELFETLKSNTFLKNEYYDYQDIERKTKEILPAGYSICEKPKREYECSMDDDFICFERKDGLFYSREFDALVLSYHVFEDLDEEAKSIKRIINDINNR